MNQTKNVRQATIKNLLRSLQKARAHIIIACDQWERVHEKKANNNNHWGNILMFVQNMTAAFNILDAEAGWYLDVDILVEAQETGENWLKYNHDVDAYSTIKENVIKLENKAENILLKYEIGRTVTENEIENFKGLFAEVVGQLTILGEMLSSRVFGFPHFDERTRPAFPM